MKNESVRRAMFEAGLKQYQLAEILGVSESRISQMLRNELPDEEQQRLVKCIEHNEGIKR